MEQCSYCRREFKNTNSSKNHENWCKGNPNRRKQTSAYYAALKTKSKGNQWNGTNYVLADSTRKKLSNAIKFKNENESQESKQKRIDTINRKVEEGTWHASLAKNHHYKYKGVDLHGNWELQYAKWLDANNIKWIRCAESFTYFYEEKDRRYTPDFYLINSDEYIEIKGYMTDKDVAKWAQFPANKCLKVLMKKELEDLKII